MSASNELLRAKAMLLIRREREVYEHRQERARLAAWLKAFRRLSLNLGTNDASTLFQAWVDAMVEEVAFQVASVCVYTANSGQLQSLRAVGPGDQKVEGVLHAAARLHLEENSTGAFANGLPAALTGLSELLRLETFYWKLLTVRGERVLLSAGYLPGLGRFRPHTAQETMYFALLGDHFAALSDNAQLIAELDGEKLELSVANRELDSSLQKLEEAQAKLVQSSQVLAEVSRRAGMADVATGVLHNVGNALNSVNISAGVIGERLRALNVTGATRAARMLRELTNAQGAGGEQQQRLVPYLEELGAHLAHERELMLTELHSLEGHIDHIKSIVARQQSYAMTFDVSQQCSVTELVDDAVSLSRHLLDRLGIVVERHYEYNEAIVVDRHKVLQILVNLLSNAKHALADSTQTERRIVLSVGKSMLSDQIEIAVRDNGVGIKPADFERLFRYGFTTRSAGHGFGLHMSSIAARELGGNLSAVSDGPGSGAVFILSLPLVRAAPETRSKRERQT